MMLPNQTPPVLRDRCGSHSQTLQVAVAPSAPDHWAAKCHNGFLQLRRKNVDFFDTHFACAEQGYARTGRQLLTARRLGTRENAGRRWPGRRLCIHAGLFFARPRSHPALPTAASASSRYF